MVDIERIDVTARNQGYYKVYVDGDEVSQHIAEREAEQRAINEAIQNPNAEVIYRHDYEVDVVAFISVSPIVGAAPQLQSATIGASGTTISFAFSNAVVFGAGGNGGFTVSLSGGGATLTYSSGSGSTTLVYSISRTVTSSETGACAYTQPGNGVEGTSGNDLATFSGTSVTNNSTATGSGAYTATHYVAPFASVAGATNDYDDLGATSWSNATNSGTPTTLGTACARAVAGNKAQCAAGVYVGDDLGSNSGPASFQIVGGSAGNPVVIFAVNPAATNYGTPALYSELRRTVDNYTNSSPVISGTYCVIDGFYFDETQAPSAPSGGMVRVGGNECVVRRIAVDRDTGGTIPYGGGYNNAPIYFAEENYDCVVSDCRIVGNEPNGGNAFNRAGIETYAAVRSTIEYCTIDGPDCGIYFKSNGSGSSTNDDTIATCRYNHIISGSKCIGFQRNESLTIHNNLLECDRSGADGNMIGMTYDASVYTISTIFSVYNNTVILTGTGANEEPYVAGIGFEQGVPFQGTFRDNLIYVESGTGEISMVSLLPGAGSDFDDFTQFDYNHYYRASGTAEWHHNGTDYGSLASWQSALSALGAEQNSSYSDPEFTNYAGGDYTLAANAQAALTSSSTGGPVGCYITGSEEIGVRASPTY